MAKFITARRFSTYILYLFFVMCAFSGFTHASPLKGVAPTPKIDAPVRVETHTRVDTPTVRPEVSPSYSRGVGHANSITGGKTAQSPSVTMAQPAPVTSNAARKQVMRDQGVPTSQQPISQTKNASGYEYQYQTPKSGGGTEVKSVQQQTLDRSHPGQKHWEAGAVKTDPLTGQARMNDYGRPKLENNKSKVNY